MHTPSGVQWPRTPGSEQGARGERSLWAGCPGGRWGPREGAPLCWLHPTLHHTQHGAVRRTRARRPQHPGNEPQSTYSVHKAPTVCTGIGAPGRAGTPGTPASVTPGCERGTWPRCCPHGGDRGQAVRAGPGVVLNVSLLAEDVRAHFRSERVISRGCVLADVPVKWDPKRVLSRGTGDIRPPAREQPPASCSARTV